MTLQPSPGSASGDLSITEASDKLADIVDDAVYAGRRRESQGYARYIQANAPERLDEITAMSNELSLHEAGQW